MLLTESQPYGKSIAMIDRIALPPTPSRASRKPRVSIQSAFVLVVPENVLPCALSAVRCPAAGNRLVGLARYWIVPFVGFPSGTLSSTVTVGGSASDDPARAPNFFRLSPAECTSRAS